MLITEIQSLLEQGASLGGEVGAFFQAILSYSIGTLIFLAFLFSLRKVPYIKKMHDFARAESDRERETSEFLKLFSPQTRIRINLSILGMLIFLMVVYAGFVIFSVWIPFHVATSDLEISVFGTFMAAIAALSLEFWVLWVLNRFKEQVSRAVRLDREHIYNNSRQADG